MILPTTEAESWVWNLISCCLTLMCLWDDRNSIHAYLITGDLFISKVSFSESESTDNIVT